MDYEHELYHYGILGMKWGIRRYQNPDGSLTSAGKKRYDKLSSKYDKELNNSIKKDYKKIESMRAYHQKKAKAISYREKQLGLDGKTDYAVTDAKLKKLYSKQIKNAFRERQYKIGSEMYNNNIAKYKNIKLKELSDPDIKKTSEYKNIRDEYKAQKYLSDHSYGATTLKLLYGEWYLKSLTNG